MKNRYLVLIGVAFLIIGFVFGKVTTENTIIITETPISETEPIPTEQKTITGLPRDNKSTPFENYTNAEVRAAINFSKTYINKPEALLEDHPKFYEAWWDYRLRVCHNETINKIMEYYNYWIISFPFGI